MRAPAFLPRHVLAGVAISSVMAGMSPSLAYANTRYNVLIPPQRLITALAELGRQTRAEILLTAQGMENLRTVSVNGKMTVRQAITHMVGRRNATLRQVGNNVYIIEDVRARPPVQHASNDTKAAPDVPAADAPAIMVSARRRPEEQQAVPLMIRQYGPDDFAKYAIRDLSDLSRITPGFVATVQSSAAAPLLVMRGQRRSVSDDNRIPLAVYVDEVPMPNQATLSPLFDIASVDVMRGPQGTLFGRNTTSGAVLVNTVQPAQGVPSYLEVGGGNYGLFRLEGAAEIPVSTGVDLRISGQRLRRNGYARMVDGNRVDDAHSDVVRALLRIAPTDEFRSTFSFDYLRGDEKVAVQTLAGLYSGGEARLAQNAPYFDCGAGACDVDYYYAQQQILGKRVSQSGSMPLFRRNFFGVSNITEYGDEKFLIRNIMAVRSTDIKTVLDGDATPLPIADSITYVNMRQFTEELQVQGKVGSLGYILGAFYLDNAPSGPMLQYIHQFVTPDNPRNIVSNYNYFKSMAVFGQVNVDAGGGLSAELGLRYTHERGHGCALRSVVYEARSHGQCLSLGGSYNRYTSGKLTWTATLSQKIGDQILYLSSRRAFRSGGYNSPTLGGDLKSFQTFLPETITDIEGGAKGRWNVGKVKGQFALAAYVGFYRDIQRPLFPAPNLDGDFNISNDPITLYINSARARISGIDLDMVIEISRRTRMNIAAAYIDTGYTRVDAPGILEGLLGPDPITNKFSYTARLSGSISLTHEIPLQHQMGSIELSADYAYNSNIRFAERISETFVVQPSYGLLGASATWKQVGGQPLDISLWGRNLTNRYYASGGGTLNPTYTAATLIWAPPRTYGLRLRYTFR